ncbi:MAG: hypothetical protein ACK4ON_05285, partial [Bacteroidia bacterium]
MRTSKIIFGLFCFVVLYTTNAQLGIAQNKQTSVLSGETYKHSSAQSTPQANTLRYNNKIESPLAKNEFSSPKNLINNSAKENAPIRPDYQKNSKTNSDVLVLSKYSSAPSFAIYNPEKSEIIYSKQIYAGEKLVNGEIQRFNNENELIENALYEDGVCKTLWQKTDNTEIHWQASPFSENSEVIVYSGNSLFSAKYSSNTDKSNKVTTHVTTSNELGTITFQSIQKNFQPNFRSITNIEFTSFSNTTLKCWCKNENDEVYLQFPYASFYPSGHVQLRGDVYVNICKKNKIKPFG